MQILGDIKFDANFIFNKEELRKELYSKYNDVLEYAEKSRRTVVIPYTHNIENLGLATVISECYIKAFTYYRLTDHVPITTDDCEKYMGISIRYMSNNIGRNIIEFCDGPDHDSRNPLAPLFKDLKEFMSAMVELVYPKTIIVATTKDQFMNNLINGLQEYQNTFRELCAKDKPNTSLHFEENQSKLKIHTIDDIDLYITDILYKGKWIVRGETCYELIISIENLGDVNVVFE